MIFSKGTAISLAFGATALCAMALPVSAGPTMMAPTKIVALQSQMTHVASRGHRTGMRHVTVRRHYVAGGRHYYYRRHHDGYPAAAALGLFGGLVGAMIGSTVYDDYDYPYGYGYGYPAYYDYGYAQPVYRYGYGYPRHYHGGTWYGGRHIQVRAPYRGHFSGYRGGFTKAGTISRPVRVHGGQRHR